MDNLLDRKITYNQYEVVDIKTVDMIVLVKTVNKYTGEIFWFVGFATKTNLIDDVKRILNLEHKHPNKFFREMFRQDRIVPITLNEEKRKEIC